MTDAEKREAARQFVQKWNGKGKEDEDDRSYWFDLLHNVMDIESVTDYVEFQKKVIVDGNTKRIDAYIPETRVLIEQKSLGIALDKKGHQSGDISLTPYEQAKRYNDNLPFDEKARWIVTSNFGEIWIYDMNARVPEPVKLDLIDLQRKYSMLDFLVRQETKEINVEMEVSIKAGEIVGLLYDAFLKQYADPNDPETLKSLNKLCVRIVFCLYAEDAGIFGKRNLFHDYMEQFSVKDSRKGLAELFKILNQKATERDKYLKDDDPLLAAFPYVNGGLFEDEHADIPPFTEEIRNLILAKASDEFDWSQISPTIFGAVFESTLNPETRRTGGMHYTSIENIHKVIDPLFLDDLKDEFRKIQAVDVARDRIRKLEAFQDSLASLKWLDPAAGSGNFLTETFLCIRRLENDTIRALLDTRKGQVEGQSVFGFETMNPIKVSINQFYGIEINDFAVTVAMTALWIAESQMMKETEDMIHVNLDFLPLKTNANIVEGNALRMDWNDVVSAGKLDYIMGNPPFSGTKWMGASQKNDMKVVLGSWEKYGTLDYVACWYKITAEYIQGTQIKCAYVSTNSICQGEQVCNLWRPLFNDYGIHIDFAYRTFIWDSEASIKARVHCIIVGFSVNDFGKRKCIFDGDHVISADNINAYLMDAENIFIDNRKIPLGDVPEIHQGCKFVDGANLIFDKATRDQLVKDEPLSAQFIRPFMMGKDFIDQTPRYCLWLKGADPAIIRKCPKILERIEKVREFRASSSSPDTRKYADTPMLPARLAYYSDDQNVDYIAIPKVSSQRRRYIPLGLLKREIISGDKVYIMPYATRYHFGVLTSNVHMAWMRLLCGRLKSDYSYSNTILYNNFPWPSPSEEQKSTIEKTAQGILDARALYPDSSLADLYDELTMPVELRKAHIANDRAVMKAYGFNIKEMSEADCVAELMKMYQTITAEKSGYKSRAI